MTTLAEAATACAHCGLPVPAALLEPRADEQFCCGGCRAVRGVLRAEGLERYYALARASEAPGLPARPTGRGYEEFDAPAFEELYVRRRADGLATVELYLEGVHCAACVWLVERVPLRIPGVAEARLDLARSSARVSWDPARTPLATIARFLDSIGYPAHPLRGVRVREMRRREDRAMLVRIAVAGASAGNVMTMAFALYGGMLHGMEAAYESLFRWSSLVVSLPAVLYSAGLFFRGAWGSLRARALHMDVPISLGILAGFGWGAANTMRGTGAIYFDSVTALIFLLLVGRYVQQRRQRGAADSAELLHALAPSSARRIDGDPPREVPIESLQPGMVVEVRAGDSIPVDGVVVDGRSSVDASTLTGESRPVEVEPGRPVHAGTLNLAARLEVRVVAAGERTRVGRLMRLVEEAASRRAPVVELADRISGWFVAVVLALAALAVALWWRTDPALAIDHAIALLIVTCPCALGLATPLAVAAAIGRAARRGILIKGGDALERLARPGRVLLDKTGTLTEGRTTLVAWEGEDRARPLVLGLEAEVEHPIARAFRSAWPDLPAARAQSVERGRDGAGVRGRVGDRRIAVGSPAFIELETIAIPRETRERVESLARDGLSPVVVAVDGTVAGIAAFGDPLRPEAAGTVAALERLGFEVGILSGDHPSVVARIAAELGIAPDEARGGVTPEGKLAAVEAAERSAPVVMVGDGVNDAAALSAASAGVAVRGGAEAALASADVFLAADGIGALVTLLEGARATMRVVRRNLVFSLLYNAAGAALALAGWINPLVAAVLMPLSSLTVITHSYRARTF